MIESDDRIPWMADSLPSIDRRSLLASDGGMASGSWTPVVPDSTGVAMDVVPLDDTADARVHDRHRFQAALVIAQSHICEGSPQKAGALLDKVAPQLDTDDAFSLASGIFPIPLPLPTWAKLSRLRYIFRLCPAFTLPDSMTPRWLMVNRSPPRTKGWGMHPIF